MREDARQAPDIFVIFSRPSPDFSLLALRMLMTRALSAA